jgi:Predicted hydrolase of the metallo-beta-lactamase superfamily
VVPHPKENCAADTQLISTTMSDGNEWKQYAHCTRTQELYARGRISKPHISLNTVTSGHMGGNDPVLLYDPGRY